MQYSRPSALLVCVVSIVAAQLALAQSRTLTAPASAPVGAKVEVAWQGAADARDFITIVPSDAAEGRYLGYEYTRQSPVALKAPPQPGNYELRYLAAASPYPTLARAPISDRRRDGDADGARERAGRRGVRDPVDGTGQRARLHRSRQSRCSRRHLQRTVRLHAQGLDR